MRPQTTILVLDDEVGIRLLLRELLHPEHHVIDTDDGFEALAWLLDRDDVDLVLLNLCMPIMTGVEFLERLQELPEAYRPRCMVITGLADHDRSYEALGVSAVVQKPFEIKALLAQVESVLRLPLRRSVCAASELDAQARFS